MYLECYNLNMSRPKLKWNGELLSVWIDATTLTEEEFASKIGYTRMQVFRARVNKSASLELLSAAAAACNHDVADLLPPYYAKKFGYLVSKA